MTALAARRKFLEPPPLPTIFNEVEAEAFRPAGAP